MAKRLSGSTVVFGIRILAGAVAMGWVGQACADPAVSGTLLQQNIPGSKINLNTPLGSVIPISYGIDGSLEGSAGAVAFYLGSATDRGKWWIEESKLCHQWNAWFNSRRQCFSIRLKANNQVEWTDQDGDTGTGTIVKLGNTAAAVPKPSVAVAAATPERAVERGASAAASVVALPQAPPSSPTRTEPAPVVPAARPPARPVVAEAPRRDMPMARIAVAKVLPQNVTKPPAAPVSPAVTSPSFQVVNVAQDDVLNVRREASATSEVVSTIPPYSAGVLLTSACVGEWCRVRFGQSIGWVHQYFLEPEQGARKVGRAADPRTAITYRVVRVPPDDTLNVRRLANGDSDVVGRIPANGSKIRMTGFCVREWCPVVHGGKAGWVNRQYLALAF